MKIALKSAATLVIPLLLTPACVSRSQLQRDYRESLKDRGTSTASASLSNTPGRSPLIFVLVDGLSVAALNRLLVSRPAGSLARFFPSRGTAVTVFPSLTFPAISSLLTRSPIDHHPITANHLDIPGKDELLDLSKPGNYRKLNDLLSGKTVFSDLAARGKTSVSLSWAFSESSDASLRKDVNLGYAWLRQHYRIIDERTLDSLRTLLRKTPANQLPDFMFVHLIGVDALAHEHGPDSAAVQDHLAWLDAQWAQVTDKIREIENQGLPIRVLLSADHGFTTAHRSVNLTSAVQASAPDLRVINEGRVAFLSLPSSGDPLLAERVLRGLKARLPLEWMISRSGDELRLERISKPTLLRVKYIRRDCGALTFGLELDGVARCPMELDRKLTPLLPANVILRVSALFHSPSHPDIALVPAADHAFATDGEDTPLGQHGGLSADEMTIPVLSRSTLKSPVPSRGSPEIPNGLLIEDLLEL